MKHGDDGDVPFDDRPQTVTEEAADPGPDTETRTPPPSGSTRPTTMREDFGTLADEGRRLWEAVEAKFVGPMMRNHPEVARHLGAAGREMLAAYRTAVRGQEKVWRAPDERRPEPVPIEPDGPDAAGGATKESHGS